MVGAMKQISLSIDINGVISNDHTEKNLNYSKIPNFLSQFAFIFDPSTLTFGPLITYCQFRQMNFNLKQDLFGLSNFCLVCKHFSDI
jgi:hypothetical protein